MTETNPYDEFAYITAAYQVGHPDRLATIATLFGMNPAPVRRCRVLELGCGDGGHLLPIAYSHPESTFTGIDLAERPIEAARNMAAHLGLRNVTLLAKDVMTVGPEFGEFDYIVAHGLYAWVPPPVQNKVLEICRANLAPDGVALVSYNAYPGSRMRDAARDMFLHFVRPLDQSAPARARARQLLEFAKRPRPEAGSWGALMVHVAEFLESHPDSVLAHDEMGPFYHPVYFHEFMERAGKHRLQYLGEAQYSEMNDRWLTPEELEPLKALEGDPLLLREQYMDFLRFRTFRQTLLCRSEVALQRDAVSAATLKLLVSTRLRPVRENPVLDAPAPEEFRSDDGARLTLTIAPAKKLVARLAAEWPRRIPASDLLSKDSPPKNVGDFLHHLYSLGMLDLQTFWQPYVARTGERPESSRLVRLQLDRQPRVTNQEHVEVEIKGEMARTLVKHCDGTRDRAALLQVMKQLDPKAEADALEKSLKGLAALAIMTA